MSDNLLNGKVATSLPELWMKIQSHGNQALKAKNKGRKFVLTNAAYLRCEWEPINELASECKYHTVIPARCYKLGGYWKTYMPNAKGFGGTSWLLLHSIGNVSEYRKAVHNGDLNYDWAMNPMMFFCDFFSQDEAQLAEKERRDEWVGFSLLWLILLSLLSEFFPFYTDMADAQSIARKPSQ